MTAPRTTKAGSARIEAVQAPIIPVVADLIRSCPGTISLGQGVVYYGPPPQAKSRLDQFFTDSDNNKYKPVEGLPLLVDAIAGKLTAENGIIITAENGVVVTAGGNMAFMNAILAITNPGDEIILQLPYYFNHEMAITMAGCRAICVPTDSSYQPNVEDIRKAITPRTRAIVTVSPNNPTGAVYSESVLREINQLCRNHGLYHISDEAYEYFTYGDARHFSPASIENSDQHTISLFSLSKAFGFASWRIGYMVVPRTLIAPIRKVQDTILICPPVISQFAAVGALEAGVAYCRSKLTMLNEVRNTALQAFRTLSEICEVPPVNGAFYFLMRLKTALGPMSVVERLIREHRVAVIPGMTFGIEKECCLRVAYGALRKETAEEGIGRLVTGLEAIIKS